jgi:hypothetical protein
MNVDLGGMDVGGFELVNADMAGPRHFLISLLTFTIYITSHIKLQILQRIPSGLPIALFYTPP